MGHNVSKDLHTVKAMRREDIAKKLRALADKLEASEAIDYLGEDGEMHSIPVGERVICPPKIDAQACFLSYAE